MTLAMTKGIHDQMTLAMTKGIHDQMTLAMTKGIRSSVQKNKKKIQFNNLNC